MVSTSKIKSVDFYRKTPRNLTEASLSGAGLSFIAAFSMIFLFGMELNDYLRVNTSTSIIVDNSSDGDFLRIDFNIRKAGDCLYSVNFPALFREFASIEVSDVLGTNRLNITKTVCKYSIDTNLKTTGSEFQSGPVTEAIKHDEEFDEEYDEGSVSLNTHNFHRISHQYDPEMDGRILLGNVDCTEEIELCRRNHIQGYPSICIFRKGGDVRGDNRAGAQCSCNNGKFVVPCLDNHGHHDHESYYGDRDTDSLVKTMENLVAPISLALQRIASDSQPNKTNDAKRPAPLTGGCRIEGFARVKKVPGNVTYNFPIFFW
ncbi:Protein disulfide-isomerase 5-3 [Abeliophyllum distichum]|uniref:Protein disulfide-isomerase 5-3 n=1 Tax=Abeliophyllum distichum TaxID=126358 RepID=A0ABD1UF64_9LAMI